MRLEHIEQGGRFKKFLFLLGFSVFKSFYSVSEYWLQGLFSVPVVGQTVEEHNFTL